MFIFFTNIIYCVLVLFLIYISPKVFASENETIRSKSQIIIANKYAERFCNAKADNFFKGLDNEKTLKYSYFEYIGLKNEDIFTTEMHNVLIHQIKENCLITNEEEKEINEFFIEESN